MGEVVSNKSLRSRHNWKTLAAIAATILAVLGIVAFTLNYKPAPPEPTIDFAAVEARAAEATAQAEATAAAEREAGKVDIAFPADRPLNVMLIGDSIAAGQHSLTEAESFRMIVRSSLESSGPVEWSGLHFAGAKVQDILDRKSPATGVDLAIIELGLNDVFKATGPELFAQRYGAYLDRLADESPGIKYLCLGIWGDPSGDNIIYDDAVQEQCEQRDGKYIRLRNEYRSPVVKGPAGATNWVGVTDSGHPNSQGHRLIADLVLERLSRLAD